MTDSKDSRGITLTLTEACNLRCPYCYEANKTPKKMRFETAKEIIDMELGGDTKETVTIDFFGGEPFLEFELMKQVCEYVWAKEWNKQYHFFASTNGTLLTPEIKQWLAEHKEQFWCGLSYDGTPAMQDASRCNSSRMIDLAFFSENWPTQGVKMTVSKETLPSLAEGVIFLHQHGFRVNCNLAYGLDWSNQVWKDTLAIQLMKLIEYYLKNPSIRPCSMLNMELVYVAQAEQLAYNKWCGAGTSMRVYSVDGKCYPCHFFEPLAIGHEKAEASRSIDFSKAVQLMDPDCNGCCLLPICPTCYGSNYAATGDLTKKDKNLCQLTKIQAVANSYFKYQLLELRSDEELGINEEQRKLITDAIITIQKRFVKEQ